MTAEVIVFLGPTISADEAREHLDALYLPPAGQGDVVRAVLQHAPSVIAIIDGVFAQRPAVRHKEILWAMAGGVRVFGASSMGAIRAAELNDFGMVGYGFIFRWYRRTALADDDDVAVPMAPTAIGSYALGDALIDIRLTLKKAEREGVVGRKLLVELEQAARSLHFVERTYSNILSRISIDSQDEISKLNGWLANGIVRQKKTDAIGLLQHISSSRNAPQEPTRISNFELTDAFTFDLKYSNLFNDVFEGSDKFS